MQYLCMYWWWPLDKDMPQATNSTNRSSWPSQADSVSGPSAAVVRPVIWPVGISKSNSVDSSVKRHCYVHIKQHIIVSRILAAQAPPTSLQALKSRPTPKQHTQMEAQQPPPLADGVITLRPLVHSDVQRIYERNADPITLDQMLIQGQWMSIDKRESK